MKRVYLKFLSMALIWGLPNILSAQINTVDPGDKVRVTYKIVSLSRTVGHLQHITNDTLHLEKKASTLKLPLASIQRLDISTGKKTRRGRGALIGAVTGGLILGVISLSSTGNNSSDSDDPWGFNEIELFSPGGFFLIGFGIGAAGGAMIGLTVGDLIKTDIWEPVPLDVALTPVSIGTGGNIKSQVLTIRWSF